MYDFDSWASNLYFYHRCYHCLHHTDAIFLKPLPYFRPKYVIFDTLFQTYKISTCLIHDFSYPGMGSICANI